MSLSDALLNSASLAHKFEGAITAGERQNLLIALAWQPVHGEDGRVDIHDFGFLLKVKTY